MCITFHSILMDVIQQGFCTLSFLSIITGFGPMVQHNAQLGEHPHIFTSVAVQIAVKYKKMFDC